MRLLTSILLLVVLLMPYNIEARNKYDTTLDSIVQLNGDAHGQLIAGSGVAVNIKDKQYIVTAGHVCADVSGLFMATDINGKVGLVTIKKIDPVNDLCLLDTDLIVKHSLSLIDRDVPFGDEVYTIAGPLGFWPFIVSGQASGTIGGACVVSMPVIYGMSGGPIIWAGRLVGIISRMNPEFNHMALTICGDELRSFLVSPN